MNATRGDGRADFAVALLDPGRPCPPGLRAWNGSEPAARLAVYRNNVLASLIDTLAETFPVLRELAGAEFFRAMASVFARSAPPSSPVLARYGDGLAAFVEGFGPARERPCLADVARLELARVRAQDAADAAPLGPDAVRAALASGAPPGELAGLGWRRPEEARRLRQGLGALVLRCPPGTAAFVSAISGGLGLGAARGAGRGQRQLRSPGDPRPAGARRRADVHPPPSTRSGRMNPITPTTAPSAPPPAPACKAQWSASSPCSNASRTA